MPVETRSRRWVFTLNNWTHEEDQRIRALGNDGRKTKYLVFGREVGDGGTPHLQGFVVFREGQRFSRVKDLVGDRCFIAAARGTSCQCREYCIKDGSYDEFGDFPSEQGKRGDVDAFVKWLDEFERDNGRAASRREIAVEQPAAFIRFPRICELAQLRAAAPQLQVGTTRSWQSELEDELNGIADDRCVLFYVDVDGGKGKSWFQRYYLSKYSDKTQCLGLGRREDLTYMIDETKSVFLFNVPRDNMQYFQYTVVEMLKDRMVTSTKYKSCQKYFSCNVHVVVFSNEWPDETKLSQDRLVIREL